ncbi:hypothetical protein QQF64_036434 [Cirrhinus molitorella]|uniref:Peptidase A1 domain-containing protein n=1 Tax=Cirrhinus molitorella TaxID=172907 RepID=A0ABR3NJ46_9TELE
MLIFTVCSHIYHSNNGSGFGGELLFGGVDETLFVPPISWAPVTQKGSWQIRLDAVKVQGALSFCYRSTIVDTGTSLIGGPARDVLLLQQFIGATPTSVGEYLIDCVRISSLPVVSFLINNVEYSLTGEQYIRRSPFPQRRGRNPGQGSYRLSFPERKTRVWENRFSLIVERLQPIAACRCPPRQG